IWCETGGRTGEFTATDHQPGLVAGLSDHGRPASDFDNGHADVPIPLERHSAATPSAYLIIDRPPENGCICCSYRVSFQPSKNKSKMNPGLTSGRRLMKFELRLPNRATLCLTVALLLASSLTAQAQQPAAPAPAPIKVGMVTFLT